MSRWMVAERSGLHVSEGNVRPVMGRSASRSVRSPVTESAANSAGRQQRRETESPLRSPADHGASMFKGAFGPVVKLTTKGIQPARPQNVPGAGTETVTVNDAVPLNTLSQYG